MSKLHIPLIVFAVVITFGLAVSLQGVFGLNIAGILTGPLNLGGNKITNVGAPTAAGDVAVKSYVVSVAGSHVSGELYGSCLDFIKSGGNPGCSASLPAFCSTPLSRGSSCLCPPGYTAKWTGSSQSDQWLYFSCYKN